VGTRHHIYRIDLEQTEPPQHAGEVLAADGSRSPLGKSLRGQSDPPGLWQTDGVDRQARLSTAFAPYLWHGYSDPGNAPL